MLSKTHTVIARQNVNLAGKNIMKTVQDRLVTCVQRHPDWTDRRVYAAIRGATAPALAQARSRLGKGRNGTTVLQPVKSALSKGKTLSQFRTQFDVREKIRQGIKSHLKNITMTDQEFREACQVPVNEWRRFASLDEFSQYTAKLKGTVFWARPEMLLEMKEILGVI